jgi:hypothetical protein
MALPTFRSTRKFIGPTWLTTDEGGEVGFVLDVVKDAFMERVRRGALVSLPQQDPSGTPAPDDALAAMGHDRQIIRGIGESSKSYAARLVGFRTPWKTAGNPFVLLDQLAGYLGPLPLLRTVDVRGKWCTRATNGARSVVRANNWDWDGDTTPLNRWARFWVIIYPNGLWQPTTWGSGAVWGPNTTWGSTALPGQVSTVQQIVRQWKPAGTRCVNIILAFDDTSFNPATARDGTGLPDGLWGKSSYQASGSTQAPSRLSTAVYWDGVR